MVEEKSDPEDDDGTEDGSGSHVDSGAFPSEGGDEEVV